MTTENSATPIMPVVFIPHGGGPLPLLGDPDHKSLTAFLKKLPESLPKPKAILMISAHWEQKVASVSSSSSPSMIYDYNGFPPESYEFIYPAPGHSELAVKISDLLKDSNIEYSLDEQRGFDHGTYVPLMLMYPDAQIPVVQVSLLKSLNPASHIELGKALAPLRKQGVLIIGSGLSFHNLPAFFSSDPSKIIRSQEFDQWLTQTLTGDLNIDEKAKQLSQWQTAPHARYCHPREEHLLPLHVCFGAGSVDSVRAERVYNDTLYSAVCSAFKWG